MLEVIQQIMTTILGTSKDAPLYLSLGMISGSVGTLIRITRSPTFGPNQAIWIVPFRWLGMILTWTLAGGLFALTIGIDPVVSVMLGLFAPTIYDLFEYNLPKFLISKINNYQFKVPPPEKKEEEGKAKP